MRYSLITFMESPEVFQKNSSFSTIMRKIKSKMTEFGARIGLLNGLS